MAPRLVPILLCRVEQKDPGTHIATSAVFTFSKQLGCYIGRYSLVKYLGGTVDTASQRPTFHQCKSKYRVGLFTVLGLCIQQKLAAHLSSKLPALMFLDVRFSQNVSQNMHKLSSIHAIKASSDPTIIFDHTSTMTDNTIMAGRILYMAQYPKLLGEVSICKHCEPGSLFSTLAHWE